MSKKIKVFTCEKCNNTFESRGKSVRFCSNSCRASVINKGRKPHNYDETKIRHCKICGKKLHHQAKTGYCAKHYYTDEYKELQTGRCKNNGGYRNGSGRGKSGWYEGYWCDSSWELAWIIYNLDHNIKFERNAKGFDYVYNGERFKYYPDFILENKFFVEIKGWEDEKTKSKMNQFKEKLIVLREKDLKEIFEYVICKYGKNFIYLYEKNTTKLKT